MGKLVRNAKTLISILVSDNCPCLQEVVLLNWLICPLAMLPSSDQQRSAERLHSTLTNWRSLVAAKLNLVRQSQEVIVGANLACFKLARKHSVEAWEPLKLTRSGPLENIHNYAGQLMPGLGRVKKMVRMIAMIAGKIRPV